MKQEHRAAAWIQPDSRLAAGIAGLVAIIVTFSAINAWSLAQPATRQEVAQTMTSLDPACRPIVGIRLRTKLVQTGRPLTRREMSAVVNDVTACPAINEQLAGIGEGG